MSSMRQKAAGWLRQGISPQRLALTLALGFAIGCIPMFGLSTALCAVLALGLRLNLPAIQAANYAALPLQIVLLAPFVRLGGWLFSWGPRPGAGVGALIRLSPAHLAGALTGFAGQALLAWLLFAIPVVALLTGGLTLILRRVPVLATAGAAESAS